jgi:hypothetical protein
MCAGCVMTAAAGATGIRSWLAARGFTWMTPARLKRATVALLVAAFGISSVGISGSSPAPARAAVTHGAHR